MLYCGGKEAYLSILEAYYEEREENRAVLDNLFAKHDWKDYTIKVHAFKSMMQNIGALPLAAKAKALELAGKRGDIGYIMDHHEELIGEYLHVIKELENSPFVPTQTADEKKEMENGGIRDAAEERKDYEKIDNICNEMPELDEETFDEMAAQLEEAMYAFDGDKMLTVLSKMQEYQYHGKRLNKELEPVKKKIVRSDYMSAIETLSGIRNRIQNDKEGGAAES